MNAPDTPPANVLDALPPDVDVRRDDEALAALADDLAFRGRAPLAAIAPATVDGLADSLRLLARHGIAVTARGGGLTYSGGYVITDRAHVVVELHRLAAIDFAAGHDHLLEIGAGATWAEVHAWAADRDLRLCFRGPASGLFATVGGSASTDAAGLGSARYGRLADQLRGLEVVTGTGEVLRLGSLARDRHGMAHDRFGPDPMGLFVGDCGAFGIKTKVALPVAPMGGPTAFGACAFDDAAHQEAALAALTASGLCEDIIALHPPFPDEDGQPACIEFATDPATRAAAVEHCTTHGGREVEATIVAELSRRPCPEPTMMVGPDGSRWLPVHGIVPRTRHGEAMAAVRRTLHGQRRLMEREGLTCGLSSMAIGRDRLLVEPSLFVPDRPPPMIRRYLPADRADALLARPARPTAEAVGDQVRRELVRALDACGAQHLQIGRLYPFRSRLDAAADALLATLKSHLDPHGILNPGVFGYP